MNTKPYDYESKQIFISYLQSKGHSVVDTDTTSIYSQWDLTSTYNGNTFAYELKARNFSSAKYGDNTVEESKITYMQKAKDAGKIDNGFIVSYFIDGNWMVNKYTDEHTTEIIMAPKTTAFTNNNKVPKRMVHYKPLKIFKIM